VGTILPLGGAIPGEGRLRTRSGTAALIVPEHFSTRKTYDVMREVFTRTSWKEINKSTVLIQHVNTVFTNVESKQMDGTVETTSFDTWTRICQKLSEKIGRKKEKTGRNTHFDEY